MGIGVDLGNSWSLCNGECSLVMVDGETLSKN